MQQFWAPVTEIQSLSFKTFFPGFYLFRYSCFLPLPNSPATNSKYFVVSLNSLQQTCKATPLCVSSDPPQWQLPAIKISYNVSPDTSHLLTLPASATSESVCRSGYCTVAHLSLLMGSQGLTDFWTSCFVQRLALGIQTFTVFLGFHCFPISYHKYI